MNRARRWLVVFALLLANLAMTLLVLLLLSPESDSGDRSLLTIFQRTIEDAQPAHANRVYDRLFPLSDNNAKLQWVERDGERWVKVVSWQSSHAVGTYYQNARKSGELLNAQGHMLWVTLVPQLQDFCKLLPRDIDPSFRLKQYLGLNPDRRYEQFVELLVRPRHVFRPCPDPDPGDTRCELNMNQTNPPQVPGIGDYNLWFAELKRESYQPYGAPWTRLGYTYDWIYGNWGVGASEYVLTPNAQYYVVDIQSTDQYCSYKEAAASH